MVMVLVGTRPEIVKMAPIIKLLEQDSHFEFTLIDSGQHYDNELSRNFFEVFRLPKPQFSLNVGSSSHAGQTGRIMIEAESLFLEYNPDVILAQGDTNTVMAAALAAVKCHLPFGHVESGLRSFDRSMPEEINRIVADQCSELLFAPTSRAAMNLLFEGCNPWKIHITGNTVVDTVLDMKEKASKESEITKRLELEGENYAVVTIHRPANVDQEATLNSVLEGLLNLDDLKMVVPIHPRTRQSLKRLGLYRKLDLASHVIIIEPLGYTDFLRLMMESHLIITDSGGLQEEALTLGKPCITLRTNTERPESVQLGANFLVGRSPVRIKETVKQILDDTNITNRILSQENPFGDGNAGKRIITGLLQFCQNPDSFIEPELYVTGTRKRQLYSVKTKFHGNSVKDVEKQLKGKIMMLYDQEGHPMFPKPSTILQNKQHFLLAIEK